MRTRFLLPLMFVAFLPLAVPAGDSWPGFRGRGDGIAVGSPPTQWSEKENVRWKTEIHGKGWSSPVVFANHVWVTTADETMGPKAAPMKGGAPPNPVKDVTYYALCIDPASGKITQNIKLYTDEKPQYCHPFNSYASSTPFIEEGRLYAHFGAPGTFCIDTDTGKVLWERLDFKCD